MQEKEMKEGRGNERMQERRIREMRSRKIKEWVKCERAIKENKEIEEKEI